MRVQRRHSRSQQASVRAEFFSVKKLFLDKQKLCLDALSKNLNCLVSDALYCYSPREASFKASRLSPLGQSSRGDGKKNETGKFSETSNSERQKHCFYCCNAIVEKKYARSSPISHRQ